MVQDEGQSVTEEVYVELVLRDRERIADVGPLFRGEGVPS